MGKFSKTKMLILNVLGHFLFSTPTRADWACCTNKEWNVGKGNAMDLLKKSWRGQGVQRGPKIALDTMLVKGWRARKRGCGTGKGLQKETSRGLR